MALLHSYELLEQVVQRGWGLLRDMYWGLKYRRELREDAEALRTVSWWSMTLDLKRDLADDFDKGF